MFVTVYVALLFFVLTPGILITLPPKGSKFVVGAVHALIFAFIFHLTHKLVWSVTSGEGFKEGAKAKCKDDPPTAKCNSSNTNESQGCDEITWDQGSCVCKKNGKTLNSVSGKPYNNNPDCKNKLVK